MLTVLNQKPATLTPIYKPSMVGAYDPREYLKQTIVQQLLNPVVKNKPVEIKHKSKSITEDQLTDLIIQCCSEVVDPDAELLVKDFLAKTLLNFDKNTKLSIQSLYLIQSALKAGLPFPSDKIFYTPATDVVPMSKQFLAGTCEYDAYFATMGFYGRPNSLGFYFANKVAFAEFKQWAEIEWQKLNTLFDAKTNQIFQDFFKHTTLSGLTESMLIRNTDTQSNEDYSFARTIVTLLMSYQTQTSPAVFGILPFDVSELFHPTSLIFINVEKHSHASAKQIADEWKLIQQSLAMKLKLLSPNKISKLTAAARSLQKITNNAANAITNQGLSNQKAKFIAFSKKETNIVDLTKSIQMVMRAMKSVMRSENTYKNTKRSFAKQNRRNPDDYNKSGTITQIKYLPDLHIYLDTSGSISEKNYRDSMQALIFMAKKLNINLYFNSFSHILAKDTKIQVKDQTLKQIYKNFQKVPKVSGGTEYEQIWHYINGSANRSRELSIIISDMEYTASTHFVTHPKHLYYIPCSNMDWARICRYGKKFHDSMLHNDPDIRKHLLF